MTERHGAAEQYNLDRMDMEEDVEEEADETEVNSNMLINVPRDQRQNLITADFFRQAILAATTTGGASASTTATVVTEVTHPRYALTAPCPCSPVVKPLGRHVQ